MQIIFKHHKTSEWVEEVNSSELPVTPIKGDIVHLEGGTYKVKKREFGILREHGLCLVLNIYVKPTSVI